MASEKSPLLGGGGALSDVGSDGEAPPLHKAFGAAARVFGLHARRARRRAQLLDNAAEMRSPPRPSQQQQHVPMTTWGSFLFLSNLICGPGMLGLPVAFRYSGTLAAGGFTCAFAAVSVLACVWIAHVVRLYRVEVRVAWRTDARSRGRDGASRAKGPRAWVRPRRGVHPSGPGGHCSYRRSLPRAGLPRDACRGP